MDKLAKVRAEVEKLNAQLLRGACSSQIAMETMCKEEAYDEVLALLDTMQEEPVSEDLEEASRNYADNEEYGDDVCFAIKAAFKAGAKWQKQQDQSTIELAEDHAMLAGMEKMKEEMMKNIWKSADGEDLPEIDREVIALTQPYQNDEHLKVVFAHRPNKYTKVWNSDLGEEQVVEIERHGKGGWNIPDVKYWLDVDLSNMED